MTKALLECAMHAEITEHLGYEKHDPEGKGRGRSTARNAKSLGMAHMVTLAHSKICQTTINKERLNYEAWFQSAHHHW